MLANSESVVLDIQKDRMIMVLESILMKIRIDLGLNNNMELGGLSCKSGYDCNVSNRIQNFA